jgi:hypothetical protein
MAKSLQDLVGTKGTWICGEEAEKLHINKTGNGENRKVGTTWSLLRFSRTPATTILELHLSEEEKTEKDRSFFPASYWQKNEEKLLDYGSVWRLSGQ